MTDYAGIALIVTPVMAGLVAIFTLFINRKVNAVHAVATKTLAVATQVDAAVNGKQPGETSLSQDVVTILEKQEADHPSEPVLVPVVTKSENGSLKLQVAYLTKLMEDQFGKVKKKGESA